MIRFKTFILPKIMCGISRMNPNAKKIEEKIEVASDIEHAETEHGIDKDQLVAHIKSQRERLPTEVEPEKPWYTEHAAQVPQESLYHKKLGFHSGELENHYNGWNDDHKKVIKQYTAGPFRDINDKILNGKTDHIDEARMEIMDSALKHHSLPKDTYFWSGVGTDHANDILTSEKVHHPSYLSSSLSFSIASSFGHARSFNGNNNEDYRHVLKIHAPKGHPGGYIEHITNLPGEHEFVFPRDTILKIDHSKRQVASMKHSWGTSHILIHHAYPVTE